MLLRPGRTGGRGKKSVPEELRTEGGMLLSWDGSWRGWSWSERSAHPLSLRRSCRENGGERSDGLRIVGGREGWIEVEVVGGGEGTSTDEGKSKGCGEGGRLRLSLSLRLEEEVDRW